jgi:hypothetical protein
MSTIKGQNLRIFMGTSVIAEATNCTISYTGNADDESTKDTPNGWSQNINVTRSWGVTVDSLQATAAQLKALLTAITSMQPVTLKWDQTSGQTNSTAVGAAFARTGSAILNDLTITAPNRQQCTVSLQFQGKGAPSTIS